MPKWVVYGGSRTPFPSLRVGGGGCGLQDPICRGYEGAIANKLAREWQTELPNPPRTFFAWSWPCPAAWTTALPPGAPEPPAVPAPPMAGGAPASLHRVPWTGAALRRTALSPARAAAQGGTAEDASRCIGNNEFRVKNTTVRSFPTVQCGNRRR
eukprot:gene3962-biopygen18864